MISSELSEDLVGGKEVSMAGVSSVYNAGFFVDDQYGMAGATPGSAGSYGGVSAGTYGGMTGGAYGGMTGGVYGGMTGGVYGGMTGGVYGGMTGGVYGGMTGGFSFEETPVNQLTASERRVFCKETTNSILAQLPLGSDALRLYIDKVCFLVSITEPSQASCEASFQGCVDDFSQVFQSYDTLVAQCLLGDLFYGCSAPAREVLTCSQAVRRYETDVILNLNLYNYSCYDAGRSMAIESIAGQYNVAPMSLCEPSAYECLP